MKWRLSVLLFLTGLCSHVSCLPHRYHFISQAVPWRKAQTYCREQYTDLATVFDIEDMNRLVNTAQDTTGGFEGNAWIGLHDNLTSWRWSFSESRFYRDREGNYRNWGLGQPDNFLGDQMCVKMWSGGVWNDSPCLTRNAFICYNAFGSEATITDRYIFVETELSWSDAQLYCRKRYTDLASVRNEEENQEIQLLAKNRSVWIGLYRTREWSDQSNSTYRYWNKGQPDNVSGKQGCTATDLGNAGLWSDEECSKELVFICYGKNGEFPDEPGYLTTPTVTPNKITTTEGDSIRTKTTSSMQLSTPKLDQTTSIPDQTLHKSSRSTTTVTPNKRTTTETESTTGHLTTEMTSSKQPSTPVVHPTSPIIKETPNQTVLVTTTTVTPNKITTIEGDSLSTDITSPEQPSTSLMDQTTSIPVQTPHKSSRSTTTVTSNKRTTTETESTTGHVTTEMTSSKQPSTPVVHPTSPIIKETPNQTVLVTTTTTTVTPNKITTIEGDSRSTDITSPEQPSTSLMDQTTSIPVQTPHKSSRSTTTVTSNKRTTTETESTTGHVSTVMTSSKQPSTPVVYPTSPIIKETPNQTVLVTTTTTTVTPNKITTIEVDSLSTDITSPEQPSTSLMDQTTSIPVQTPHKSSRSTTTVTPNKRTTTETESTTGHVSTVMTSSKQPSTPVVHPTSPISNETPNRPVLSTTTVTQNKLTTADKDPVTTERTSMTPDRTTTTDTVSTTGHVSAETTSVGQPVTKEVGETKNILEHVVNLEVKFTSKIQLSEDDIKKLVLVKFHSLVREMGVTASIKVGLKRPPK